MLKTVLYSGNVQGVGFRYTVQRIANGYLVSGYVRNTADNRVELVAEGEPAEVDTFLDDVASQLDVHIKQADVQTADTNGQYDKFEIRY